jgi:hypothetical protein
MSIVGSYSVLSLPNSTLSYQYSDLDDLLVKLLDNSDNLIDPIDIRDPVLTLWRKIEGVESIAASAASASSLFSITDTTVSVGGITQGTSYSNEQVINVLTQLLKPHVGPVIDFTLSGSNVREFRSSSLPISVTFSVFKRNLNISSIVIDGLAFTTGFPWTSNVSGTVNRPGYHPSLPGSEYVQIFSFTASDGIKTTNATSSITWQNQVYWGTISLSSIGNPNLTINPGSYSMVASQIPSSYTGVFSTLNKKLSNTKNGDYNSVGSTGNYIMFAWPSSVIGSTTPTFRVNGVVSTAFTLLKTSSNFQNQFLFDDDYEVWITNTVQNSPIDINIS